MRSLHLECHTFGMSNLEPSKDRLEIKPPQSPFSDGVVAECHVPLCRILVKSSSHAHLLTPSREVVMTVSASTLQSWSWRWSPKELPTRDVHEWSVFMMDAIDSSYFRWVACKQLQDYAGNNIQLCHAECCNISRHHVCACLMSGQPCKTRPGAPRIRLSARTYQSSSAWVEISSTCRSKMCGKVRTEQSCLLDGIDSRHHQKNHRYWRVREAISNVDPDPCSRLMMRSSMMKRDESMLGVRRVSYPIASS